MSVLTARVLRPNSRPHADTTAATDRAPSGIWLALTRRSTDEPGSIRSRLSENSTRVAVACTAIPQAMNAASTTISNGFSAQEPNASVTAGVTGSSTSPDMTAFVSSNDSPIAIELRMITKPTEDNENRIARGTRRIGSTVSSDTEPQESKPTNAQPLIAIAARNAAKYVWLPKLAADPRFSHRNEIGWLRKNSSRSSPMSTLAMHSAMIPTFTTYLSGFSPIALTVVVMARIAKAHSTCWFADGVAPNSDASQTAPKYAIAVTVSMIVQTYSHPANQAYVGPTRRRLHW